MEKGLNRVETVMSMDALSNPQNLGFKLNIAGPSLDTRVSGEVFGVNRKLNTNDQDQINRV